MAQALSHHQAGRLAEADSIYQQILSLRPNHPEALNYRGLLAHQLGRSDVAFTLISSAIKQRPKNPSAHNHLGLVLKKLGRLDEAIASFTRALRLQPKAPDVLTNLGSAQREKGLWEQATRTLEKAVKLNPNYAPALNNLGTALLAQHHYQRAEVALRKALKLDPKSGEGFCNLAKALYSQARLDEAQQVYQQALALNPNNAVAHAGLGLVRRFDKDYVGAVEPLRRAIALNPVDGASLISLISSLQYECDWDTLNESVDQLNALINNHTNAPITPPIIPWSLFSIDATPAQQLICAKNYSAATFGSGSHEPAQKPKTRATQDSRITLGYISPDFGDHPVRELIQGVLERHDRERFKVLAYDNSDDPEQLACQDIIDRVDGIVYVGKLHPAEAAKKIRADKVDILIDLAGYTSNTPLFILAHRPAPVQVSYLGYAGTSGTPFIDYLLADAQVAPLSHQDCFSEQLVHLPECFLKIDHRNRPGPAPSRTACGLPEDGLVLCCFTQPYKLTPEVFTVWMEVLKQVPDAILWLKKMSARSEAALQQVALDAGVAPERLIFAPLVGSKGEHLARMRCADLYLDTSPYNAHSTTAEFLSAGVPVLTRPGESFASRVASSVVVHAGLAEMSVGTLEQYTNLALELATNREKLAALRARLAAHNKAASTDDDIRYVRHIEAAYEQMWSRHMAGAAPTPIQVPAD